MKTVMTNRQGREFLGSARVNGTIDAKVENQVVMVSGKGSGVTIVLGLSGGKQLTLEINEKSMRAIEKARSKMG